MSPSPWFAVLLAIPVLLLGEWRVRRAPPLARFNVPALVERFGPAPRAFLVVPIVGSFLIDLVNAVNITAFLNLLRL